MKTPTKWTSYRLAAVLSLAFAATGAWAEDWTVSENTTLTEDLTVDALTVNSGVTLDLAGYKLTCTSIDGEGTITSLGTDLTAPGGTCWASPSAAQVSHGTVANLFSNNYTYNPDATHRFLLASNRLPVCIDYNFGAGNAQVVNAYKLWAGWKQRAPKAWTLYGSNNDSAYQADSETDWVAIDSHSGETDWWQENGNAKDYTADDNTYTCDNTTAYRYYRLKVTERVGGNAYFELVQLEYFCATPGELHVNVASGTSAWPASIKFSGNVKVVKEGAGMLESAGDLNMNGATFVIAAGTVKSANVFRLARSTSDKAVNVEVAEGGTLYSGGILAIGCSKDATLTVNGGRVYSGGDLRVGNNGSSTATLTIKSGTVETASDKIVGLPQDGTGTLNLDGGTLITKCVKIAHSGSGTLNFNGGTLQANTGNTTDFINTSLTAANVLAGGGTIDANGYSVTIAKALTGAGAMTFKGGGTITLSAANDYTGGTTVEVGTKVATSDATAKSAILANLVVDGRTQLETGTYSVLEYSAGGLTDGDLTNIKFINCGDGTTAEVADGGTKINVQYVHAEFASEWTLDLNSDKKLSEAGMPRMLTDGIIYVTVTEPSATLTVDKNVSVGQIEFTTGDGATLKINEGYTLTTGDITGAGGILNNGTIVKTGSGTVTWPFDNNSTGITQINAGTVKVKSVANTGKTKYGFRPDDTTQQLIDVKAGATFDMNGIAEFIPSVRLAEGAHFVNTGSTIGYNKKQTVQLILDGDADVSTTGGEFGLIAPDNNKTRLDLGDLGSNTLTLDGTSTFRLSNTTINGTGTINVKSGTLTIKSGKPVTGENCTLAIGSDGMLNIGHSLSVKNFTNGGTIIGTSTLTVTGTLTPGKAIPKLTLTDGATVKASATTPQTVSTTFSASGTVYIDASDITKAQLDAATDERIPVLTVPSTFDPTGVTWLVTRAPVEGCRRKWVDNGDGTSTLYLCKPTGLMIIFT